MTLSSGRPRPRQPNSCSSCSRLNLRHIAFVDHAHRKPGAWVA